MSSKLTFAATMSLLPGALTYRRLLPQPAWSRCTGSPIVSRYSGWTVAQSSNRPSISIGRETDHGDGAYAFESPDVGDHLIVVIVAVPSLHRLDVATEFGVELVDERHWSCAMQRHIRWAEPARDPLIPIRDENETPGRFRAARRHCSSKLRPGGSRLSAPVPGHRESSGRGNAGR